ncbi:MAG TPA: FAD-dependent oxidoreductase, partial [Allocoleopsis sp.]
MTAKRNLIVIGNGMVGHKFLELMVSLGAAQHWNLITFCEESRVAYDRVNLSSYFSGKTAADLSLVEPGFYQDNGIQIYIGDKAVAIDRENQTVSSANGLKIPYDKVVLAMGSYPFVPPIEGNDAPGTFVYRTIEDLEKIANYAKHCKVGVVVGGGLLGLECANALKNLGLETHIVEFAPRLMSVQIDEMGGILLRDKIKALGVKVHTSKSTTKIVSENGKIVKMIFADGSELETDTIVFSAGIRPRDELARSCGLAIGERGGIAVNDECQTSDPNIYAIGECALYQNRIYGLVAPGYTMASVAADILSSAADDGQDARP